MLERTVDRSPGGNRFDRQIIRSIAGITPFRLDDDKLDKRIVGAARMIERKTGLKLFPGTYTAEFRYPTLVRNNNHATRPLIIPGLSATATTIMLGDTDLTAMVGASQRTSDGLLSLALWPPDGGWLETLSNYRTCPSMLVEFTAGSQLPDEMQELVGITFRWRYDQRPEDQMILKEQYPLWQPRDQS